MTAQAADTEPVNAAAPARGLLVIERILRDRAGLWAQIYGEREIRPLIGALLASSGAALACYGAGPSSPGPSGRSSAAWTSGSSCCSPEPCGSPQRGRWAAAAGTVNIGWGP